MFLRFRCCAWVSGSAGRQTVSSSFGVSNPLFYAENDLALWQRYGKLGCVTVYGKGGSLGLQTASTQSRSE